MAYFKTKEVAAISICATLWGVLNTLFAPIFFRMFGLPFLMRHNRFFNTYPSCMVDKKIWGNNNNWSYSHSNKFWTWRKYSLYRFYYSKHIF